MLTLHVTIYELDDDAGTRFQVYAGELGNAIDVTDQYEITAIATDTNRGGFAVLKKSAVVVNSERHPTGAEL